MRPYDAFPGRVDGIRLRLVSAPAPSQALEARAKASLHCARGGIDVTLACGLGSGPQAGGGVANAGTVTFTNSTVARNASGRVGGGVFKA
jgi:hypothetical protein